MRSVPRTTDSANPMESITCALCPRHFSNFGELGRHVQVEHGHMKSGSTTPILQMTNGTCLIPRTISDETTAFYESFNDTSEPLFESVPELKPPIDDLHHCSRAYYVFVVTNDIP